MNKTQGVKVADVSENGIELVLGRAGNSNFIHKHAADDKLSGKNTAKYTDIHSFMLNTSLFMKTFFLICSTELETCPSQYADILYFHHQILAP